MSSRRGLGVWGKTNDRIKYLGIAASDRCEKWGIPAKCVWWGGGTVKKKNCIHDECRHTCGRYCGGSKMTRRAILLVIQSTDCSVFNTGIGFTWLSTLYGASTFSQWCFNISRQLKFKMCTLVRKTRIETNIGGLWQHLVTKLHLFQEDCDSRRLGLAGHLVLP